MRSVAICPLLFSLMCNLAIATATNPDSNKFIHDLVHHLWTESSAEIVLFTDKMEGRKARLAATKIQNDGIPIYLMTLESMLEQANGEEACPIFTTEGNFNKSPAEEMMRRTSKPLPETKNKKAIMFMMDGPGVAEEAGELVNKTVVLCPQKIDPGIFSESSHLFFFVQHQLDIERISGHHLLRHHPSMQFVLPPADQNEDNESLLFCRLPCNSASTFDNYGFVGSSKDIELGSKILKMLEPPSHFFHRSIHGLTLVQGLENDQQMSESTKQSKLPLVSILERNLHFNISISGPGTPFQGVGKDGQYLGVRGAMARFETDVLINLVSMLLYNQKIARLSQAVYGTSFYVTFVTPSAKAFPKYLALLRPYSLGLWLSLMLALILTPLCVWIMARLEEKRLNIRLRHFSSITEALWYCIGTWCGESVGHQAHHRLSNTLRVAILPWLLFCFIMNAAYGGTLYSILHNPGTQQPINSVEDILESGLKVIWPLYGFLEEDSLAKSSDENKRALWDARQSSSVYSKPMEQWLEEVQEGESVLVLLSQNIEEILPIFTTPSGKVLLHYPQKDLGVVPPSLLCYTFPKLSPYGRRISLALEILVSQGIQSFAKRREFASRRETFLRNGGVVIVVYERSEYDAFTLDDVQGHLIFIAVSLGMGIVLWLVEIMIHRKKEEARPTYGFQLIEMEC